METIYKITVNMTTLKGMMEIGCFFMGSDPEYAETSFRNLSGSTEGAENAILRLDLVKKDAYLLPVTLKSIGCTLNEYTRNCKIITRDVFKLLTLEKTH